MRLPAGVQAEVDAAIQRTGWTPQLTGAVRLIQHLVCWRPADVERSFSAAYQRMDGSVPSTLDNTEEIELTEE